MNTEKMNQSTIQDVKEENNKNMLAWNKKVKENPKGMEKLLKLLNKETEKYMTKMKIEAHKMGLEMDLMVYAMKIEEISDEQIAK